MISSHKELKRLEALQKAAYAPRRSWLAKYRLLTKMQESWVISLLCIWGDTYGGRTKEESNLCGGSGFWSSVLAESWTIESADRITRTLNELRKAGHRGEGLLIRAELILWPQKTFKDTLAACDKRENENFIEQAILRAVNTDNPVYVVGEYFYGRHKTITEICRKLQAIAPWLTDKQARDRVKWCLQHFQSCVYLSLKSAISTDNQKAGANKLENKS